MKQILKVLILNMLFAGILNAMPISNIPTFEYEGAYDYFILSKYSTRA